MKPAHSKPFNLADAQAGAPIGTSGKGLAQFVAYSEVAHPSCCVIVLEGTQGLVGTRRKSGRVNESDATDNPFDLVMLPLGMIDGKPVFTGDMLLYARKNTEFAAMAQHRQSDFDAGMGCTWPVPARVYPQTLMTGDELRAAAYVDSFDHTVLRCVADDAIRHAIDAGQVVIPSEPTPGVRKHNPYTGHLRDQRDIASDPMGILIHCKGETVIAADRDARDLLVAKAIHAATIDANFTIPVSVALAIIATVPK